MTSSAGQPARWERHAPGLASLRHYRRAFLRRDVLAGATVAAYLIPQVMAYAELAGVPAIRGLWAAVGPLVVYALLGTSRRLSAGPESTTALMTATAVGALTVGDPQRYAGTAAALALVTGVVCVIGRFARLGYLAELLSTPVLTGYMTGIAVLMVVSQLGKVTGMTVGGDGVFGEIWYVLAHLRQVQAAPLILSTAVVVLLLVGRRVAPRLPTTLIVIALAAAVVGLVGPDRLGLAVVGEIPRGLPLPALPPFAGLELIAVVPAAVGIAVVAFSDNVLTGRAFADDDDPRIDGSQELLALGGANLAASLLQGFPVSSSGSRTAIAQASGARTQLSSLVAAALVVATLVALGPLLQTFPLAALGGLVVFAATGLVDLAAYRRLTRFRRSELVLALITTVAVLALDVLYGIAVAVALSILDLLRRIARPHDGILGYIPGLGGMHDVADYPRSRQVAGLVVYRYDSPLFFANANDFAERALKAVDEAEGPVRWFLLNAEANVDIDSTAAGAVEDLCRILTERGIVFAVARVKFEVYQSMEKAGLVAEIGAERFFPTLPEAVEAYRTAGAAGVGAAGAAGVGVAGAAETRQDGSVGSTDQRDGREGADDDRE